LRVKNRRTVGDGREIAWRVRLEAGAVRLWGGK